MILFILFTILVIILVWLCVMWYIEFFRLEKYLKSIPGPRAFPIIGSVHNIGIDRDLIPSLMKNHEKFGNVVKFMYGYVPKVFLFGQKEIAFILSSNSLIDKSSDYKLFHSWLGTGILTSTGKKWRQRRKLLTPAFHFNILENFIEIFEAQSSILLNKLNMCNGQEVDIYQFVNLLALDIICEAAMKTTVNAQKNSDSEYVRSVKEINRIIFSRSVSAFKYVDIFFQFTNDYLNQKSVLNILHQFTDKVITKRKNELAQKNDSDDDNNKIKSFLDILLHSSVGNIPLPDHSIREEVDTIMFEGHDTTSSAISFTLYCLAKYQDVQEKVFQELSSINDKDKPLTYKALQDMKYLEQVIKETMRLYPPVPLFGRRLKEDLIFNGHHLPKNLDIVVFSYALHRQQSIFPNPDHFDPDRFSVENSKDRSIYSYVPFSAGLRNCIGQRFAMLEIKSVVSNVIWKYKLLPVLGHEPDLILQSILYSYNGLPVKLQNRSAGYS